MKLGYNTIGEEGGESEHLMKAGIPEAGGSGIKKKQLVFFALGLVIISFLIGHLTNTLPSGVQMSKELMGAQPCDSLIKEMPQAELSNWCDHMDGKVHDWCWGGVAWFWTNTGCPDGYDYVPGCWEKYSYGAGYTLFCKKQPDFTVSPPLGVHRLIW